MKLFNWFNWFGIFVIIRLRWTNSVNSPVKWNMMWLVINFCRFRIAGVAVEMSALKFSTMFRLDLLWLSFATEFLFIAHAVVVYRFHHSLYISVTIDLCSFCALGLLPSFGFCAAYNWCFFFTFPLFTCVWLVAYATSAFCALDFSFKQFSCCHLFARCVWLRFTAWRASRLVCSYCRLLLMQSAFWCWLVAVHVPLVVTAVYFFTAFGLSCHAFLHFARHYCYVLVFRGSG